MASDHLSFTSNANKSGNDRAKRPIAKYRAACAITLGSPRSNQLITLIAETIPERPSPAIAIKKIGSVILLQPLARTTVETQARLSSGEISQHQNSARKITIKIPLGE